MGAQPKPRSGVASLARHDLPSRAAVMLTCAVCSLLRASCLFSRSHPPFSFPLFLSPSPLALSSVTHAKGLALASVSIATVQASIPQSGPRLRFGATPLVPCPFAFQPNLDSVCCVAEQPLNIGSKANRNAVLLLIGHGKRTSLETNLASENELAVFSKVDNFDSL